MNKNASLKHSKTFYSQENPSAFAQDLSIIFALYTIVIELSYTRSKSTTVGILCHRNSERTQRDVGVSMVGDMRTKEEKECPGF